MSTTLDDLVGAPPAADGPPTVDAHSPGRVRIGTATLINMASCDYLGFSHDPRVVVAARDALEAWGLGAAATRVLSGTTRLHRDLERRLADWVGAQDAVLYGSCWTANAAVFEGLAVLARDAGAKLIVLSDRLNHASIIDAVRAQRSDIAAVHRFDHGDGYRELAAHLATTGGDTITTIVTDGVFSMEGDHADLATLVRLARDARAVLVIDDSHGTGVSGPSGRGTAEAAGVLGQVDITTGTLGKALGGAPGGFVATTAGLAAKLRSGSRPFVFSNNPPAAVLAGALTALDILATDAEPLARVRDLARRLRAGVRERSLSTVSGEHPIVPVLLGDDDTARAFSRVLREDGIFAGALTFPIVARGEARLRLQVSAAHTDDDIDRVLASLGRARDELMAGAT